MKKLAYIFHYKNSLIVVYIIFVVFNFVFFLSLKQEREDTIANKNNISFPLYDSAGIDKYMENINKYYVDYFPFKYNYISLSNTLKTKVFDNLNSSSNVIVGKDGWIFYNACVFDSLGMNEYVGYKKWNKEQLSKVARNVRTIERWCNAHQIKFELIICPNKQSIYEDYLPACYKKKSENRYDQLISILPNTINIKKMFLNFRKKSNFPLYYKTDTHWNLFGAYLVCNELNQKFKRKFPLKNFNQISLKTYQVNRGFDLANMLALKDDYTDYMDSLVFIKPAIYKIPHLVIVHDSYLSAMEPSLNYMFSKITQRNLYEDGIPSPEFLINCKADVFVIELVERYKEFLTKDIPSDFYE